MEKHGMRFYTHTQQPAFKTGKKVINDPTQHLMDILPSQNSLPPSISPSRSQNPMPPPKRLNPLLIKQYLPNPQPMPLFLPPLTLTLPLTPPHTLLLLLFRPFTFLIAHSLLRTPIPIPRRKPPL